MVLEAPGALRVHLPRLRAVLELLSKARHQAPGKSRTDVIFSPAAREAALAIELALDDLSGWASGLATEKRNGNLMRIIQPKRRGDARTETGEGGGTGEGTGSGEGTAGDGTASEEHAAPKTREKPAPKK